MRQRRSARHRLERQRKKTLQCNLCQAIFALYRRYMYTPQTLHIYIVCVSHRRFNERRKKCPSCTRCEKSTLHGRVNTFAYVAAANGPQMTKKGNKLLHSYIAYMVFYGIYERLCIGDVSRMHQHRNSRKEEGSIVECLCGCWLVGLSLGLLSHGYDSKSQKHLPSFTLLAWCTDDEHRRCKFAEHRISHCSHNSMQPIQKHKLCTGMPFHFELVAFLQHLQTKRFH